METTNVRDDEVALFKVLPDSETSGTAYDYYLKFNGFDEELYYILELATRQNADPDTIIELCREVVDTRQKQMLDNFYNKLDPNEMLLDTDDIIGYTINGVSCPDLYELKSSD